jgi:hypothetical protein
MVLLPNQVWCGWLEELSSVVTLWCVLCRTWLFAAGRLCMSACMHICTLAVRHKLRLSLSCAVPSLFVELAANVAWQLVHYVMYTCLSLMAVVAAAVYIEGESWPQAYTACSQGPVLCTGVLPVQDPCVFSHVW